VVKSEFYSLQTDRGSGGVLAGRPVVVERGRRSSAASAGMNRSAAATVAAVFAAGSKQAAEALPSRLP